MQNMLNGDSSPIKTFFKLMTLEVNSALKATMDFRERLCQKTGFGCWTIRYPDSLSDPTQQRYSDSPSMVFL